MTTDSELYEREYNRREKSLFHEAGNVVTIRCKDCAGTGKINGVECEECEGAGKYKLEL